MIENPKDYSKSNSLHITMPQEVMAMLDELAKAMDGNRSGLLTQLVREEHKRCTK